MQSHIELLHCHKLLVLILLASFAPIGGRADDRMTAPSIVNFGPAGGAGLAELVELLDSAAAAAALDIVAGVVGVNTASPVRAAVGGIVPRDTAAGPKKIDVHAAWESFDGHI